MIKVREIGEWNGEYESVTIEIRINDPIPQIILNATWLSISENGPIVLC